jgi:hypothetical protein
VLRTFVVSLALAYIMPSFSVLKRLAGNRDDLTLVGLKMDGLGAVSPAIARGVADDLGTQWSSGELTLTAQFSVRFPGRCRLDLSSPDTTKVITSANANGKKRHEGPAFAAAQVAVDEACALLGPRSGGDGETRAALEKHLSSLKVNMKETRLGRFAGTVAFVIGEKADTAPQLWVYKDKFVPARLKFTDETGAQWDLRFLDYASQATSEWFPRVIEVYKGLEPQLKVTVLTADAHAELKDVVF